VLSEAEEAGNQELESVKRPRLSQTDLGFVFAVQVGSRKRLFKEVFSP
jgi:hypothetical protein